MPQHTAQQQQQNDARFNRIIIRFYALISRAAATTDGFFSGRTVEFEREKRQFKQIGF